MAAKKKRLGNGARHKSAAPRKEPMQEKPVGKATNGPAPKSEAGTEKKTKKFTGKKKPIKAPVKKATTKSEAAPKKQAKKALGNCGNKM